MFVGLESVSMLSTSSCSFAQTPPETEAHGSGLFYNQAWVGRKALMPLGGRYLGVSHMPEQVLSSSSSVSFKNSDT